jgi:putative tricarboxylic transport membrane protein
VAYFYVALDLEWGRTTRPGPGFFPRLLALLGLVLAGSAAFLARPPVALGESERGALPFTLALLAFCVLLEPLGFVLAGMLFTGLLARLLGAVRWWQVAAVALPTPIILKLIFAHAFQISLPAGLLVNWV